ncbi:hypothetical protein [Streptomyces sp. NPDC058653]|uniref:hypothetical protein n=1 Tax=Streptomyces sp. NPDC058653 TaxID=3346576 RepID=UPI003657F5FA
MQARSGEARQPELTALRAAEAAAKRARSKAQIRYRFVQRQAVDDAIPPLAHMIRGGRGGQVRLKLFLSMLWMQTDDTGVPLPYPSRVWAVLLGLEDPAGKGARRVAEALAWLERNGYVTVAARPGHANVVTVLHDSGNGEPYAAPGFAANRERARTGRATEHRYVQLPLTFWTKGHLSVLSGAAVAMLLALLCERGAGEADKALWFSPGDAERRFALSEDTRGKGLKELAEAGLVQTRRRPINPTEFDALRVRNVHELRLERLSEVARISRVRPNADFADLMGG